MSSTKRVFNHRGGWGKHIDRAYRSGLEEDIAKQLEAAGIPVSFETLKIKYKKPSSNRTYTPDFVLPNGIIIESKGLFDASDRKKHLLIRAQYPHLDIRFVFNNPNQKLYKDSPTTYGGWCKKNGFFYAKGLIPIEWLKEKERSNIEVS